MIKLTVAIAVGPGDYNKRHLHKCLDSIRQQQRPPEYVLIVDDAAHLDFDDPMFCDLGRRGIRTHKFAWNLGICAAYNTCVSLAPTDWVYLMSSDDELMPHALLEAEKAIVGNDEKIGWYWPFLFYDKPKPEHPEGLVVTWPVFVGVVHREIWLRSGGLQVVAEKVSPDYALRKLLQHMMPDVQFIGIGSPENPTYYSRYSVESYTGKFGQWGTQFGMYPIAEKVVELWEHPKWTEGFR